MSRGPAVVIALALVAACTTAEPVADTDGPLTVTTSDASTTSWSTAPPATDATTTAPPEQILDLPYNAGGERQTLDVNLPAGDGPFPVILAIHGGRFRFNSKAFYRSYAGHFPSSGIAFVPMNYRFVPASTYPDQVEDVHCALAWIHANADAYGFDTERVIVLGGSSGGYLAAILGTVDDRSLYAGDCPHVLPEDPIAGAVIFYGFFDFNSIDDYPRTGVGPLQGYWGAPYDELSVEQRAEMSPISWVDGSEPPFLVIHGSRDTTIPPVMSERFVDALDEAAVPAEYVLVDSGHGFEAYPLDFPEQTESITTIERFIADLP